MRKIFTTLKSVVSALVIAAMAFSVSCSYDDTAINDRVQQVENDLAALTERVAALETKLQAEVESLTELINGKVVVVDVVTDEAGNQTIKLSNGKEITVLAPVECNSLQYRVTDGVLEVSADGQNWVAVKVAPEQVVAEIVVAENTATIKLANGEEFTVVKAELIEFEATRSDFYVIAGQTKEVPFSINDAVAEINVMNQPFGWSATVEEATAEEENGGDAGVMPLAAGGKNYVLKVNGPSAELVSAGYAAKEGVVSVHFNTAAGACKVATINVTLAEITLDVDADGNITIVNTIAMEQENYWGEKFFDFADFWIGVMPKSLYDEHGKDALRNDFVGWDYETAAATQRSSGLWNVAELQQYQEGVYEKEVIEVTVDQLASAFYPKYNFAVGQEYVFFISLDSEMVNYNQIPLLENAILANYKKVLVSAEFVEGSALWNDLTFKFSLSGYQYYVVGWLSDTEVQEYMADGQYASVEEFISQYIQGYGLMSAGAILSGDFIDQEIKLSQMAELSLTMSAPSINAGTKYHFYVYPFNAATEMELYQHEVVSANLRYYGEFSTADLAVGSFDPAPEYTVIEHVEDSIAVEVAFSSDVTSLYYTWFEKSEAMDPENAAYLVMNDVYGSFVQFDEYVETLTADKFGYYGLPNPIYLAIVTINANGEYVYVEKEFKYIEPEPIALVSWEYKGRHLDIDDNVETSGGDHVYVATTVDGQELTFGLYYTLADENGNIAPGEYDYCANYFDAMYSYWNGFVYISDDDYSGSKMIVTEDTIKIKLKGGNIYLYDKNATPVVPEPEEPEVLVMDSIVRANFKNSKLQFFHQVDGANVYCAGFYNYDAVDAEKMFIPEGEYVVGTNFYVWGYSNVYDYVAKGYNYDFDEGGVMKVSEVNGAYHVEFSGTLNEGTVVLEFVYDGLIENLILPSEYKEPEGLFVPVRADVEGLGDGDSNWKGWFYDEVGNCLEVEGYWDLDAAGYGARGQFVPVDGEPVVATFTKSQNPIANGSTHYYFNLEGTWEGGYVKMQALSLPVVEKDKAEFVLPNCEDLALQLCTVDGFTSASAAGYGDIRLVDANGKNYINIEINDQSVRTCLYTYDGTNSYDPGTLYSTCCYVNYNGAGYDDSTAYTPAFAAGTVDVDVDGDACTITVDLTLEDGNKYSGVYNGAIPF